MKTHLPNFFTKLLTVGLLCCVFAFCNILVSSAQQFVTSIEAEAGTRAGGLTIATANAGYSGTGYVTNMNNTGDNLTVSVTVPSAGNYSLVIRYNGPYGPKDQDVYVNGQFVSSLNFPQTTTYTDLTAGSLSLNAGVNTISIHKNWGYTDFDKFTLYTVPLHDYSTVAATPIDANATAKTKALYNFLKSSYGTTILSGQTSDFYNTVSPNTAKKPVIRAYDFQHYTVGYSYKWNNTTNSQGFGWEDDGTTQAAIDWYNSTCQKGIVAFHWHWHSPSGGQAGTNTFYTNSTTFDVSKAVTQGTAEYTAIIRDIDSIATQLKKLQTAGVPVMWRPLHEAGGAWFWWGAKGSAPALALWDIVYNRITNYHNIHNLIWQWSTPEPTWYPGNSKVDMLGYDSYPGAYNYGTQKLIFDQLYTLVNGQKMLAMTENGPIPDPDACFTSDAKWAYFMSWSDLVTQQNSAAQLSLVYNHTKVTTLDEMPNATGTIVLTAAGPTTFCAGGNVLLNTTTGTGYTYKWYNGANIITGATSASYSATVAGSYTVIATTPNACAFTSNAIVVTVNAKPTITGNVTVCAGSILQLTGSATAAATAPWVSASTTIANVSNAGMVTGVAAGTSIITYTNSNGCTNTIQITVNPKPTITGNATVCVGSTTQLTGSATAATTAPWVSASPTIATVNSTGMVTGVAAGTSIITYTNSNGCTNTVQITVNPKPTITGNATVCVGSTTQLTGSATAAATAPWVSATTTIATVSSTGMVTGVAAGTSIITYTNSNGCVISKTMTVTASTVWYLDSDGDGKGDPAATTQACAQPNGYVAIAGDACPNDVNKIAPGNCGCGATENSCLDCMGVPNGSAALDVCNVCAGGTSGITPKTNISQCATTATVSSLASGLKVYPNPSATEFTIEVSSGTFTATIYNAAGLKISSNTYETNGIVGANLPQGIYMVYIEQDGNVELRKLVKE
jgi:mannan endo-1,4-beta-mannosidase